MAEQEITEESNQGKKAITFLWIAALILFLASAAVIVGLWMSSRSEIKNSNLALSIGTESGEVMGASSEDADDLVRIVEELKVGGVILYGYDGNAESRKQLAIFGQAVSGLDYVECNSQSSHSNPDECVAKGIEAYPTWVKGDQKFTGYKSLEDLEKIIAGK